MSTWTPAEWATFFVSAGGFIAVLAAQIMSIIVSIGNGKKADANAAKIDTTAAKVDANTALTQITHDQVNGQSAALLKVTGDASFAAGQKDQLAQQNAADAKKAP